MFKKFMSLLATVAVLTTMTAVNVSSAATGTLSVSVSDSTFDPADGSVTINVTSTVNEETLYVYVLYPAYQLYILADHIQMTAGTKSYTWYGRTGNSSTGTILPDGDYTVKVFAENPDNSAQTTITLNYSGTGDDDDDDIGCGSNGVIENFCIDPSGTWDPSDEELQIDFELNKDDIDDVTIEAQKGNKDVEIYDDSNLDADDYSEEWNGEDDDGDYVSSGDWEIVITADGDEVRLPLTIAYEQPEITEAFVTKTSFDNTIDEYTTLVYKVDNDAVVTVEVYDGTHREITLVDEEDVEKNDWNTVVFDGFDDDDDELDEGDYTFKITAENSNGGTDGVPEEVDFEIEEDDVSNDVSNVTNDSMEPVIFDDEEVSSLDLDYCIDEDAEVFAAIYKGTSAGSSPKIELVDYIDQSKGCHTISWDGKDDDNDKLSDGIYSYKIISKDGSKKDTEIGRFVIGDGGNGKSTPKPPTGGKYSCSMYNDMYNLAGTELCDAVGWATSRGIVHGYPNGTFGPYQNIKRVEVLKVILKAFQTMLLPANGSNLGFKDLNPYGWYMTYVRTAQFYGMLEGYGDGTARPETNINRVQALKFVLEASEAFTGQLLIGGKAPYVDVDYTKWYAQYVGASYTYQLFDLNSAGSQYYLHPSQLAKRGEIILMLYRLNKAGFLK